MQRDKIATKAIESLKYPNQLYFFKNKLGKGTQATVWKFDLNE